MPHDQLDPTQWTHHRRQCGPDPVDRELARHALDTADRRKTGRERSVCRGHRGCGGVLSNSRANERILRSDHFRRRPMFHRVGVVQWIRARLADCCWLLSAFWPASTLREENRRKSSNLRQPSSFWVERSERFSCSFRCLNFWPQLALYGPSSRSLPPHLPP